MITNIKDIVCDNMPTDPNDGSYTDIERTFYNLIVDSPTVEDFFKQNPVTAAFYFYSLVDTHRNYSVYQSISSSDISNEYFFEGQDDVYIVKLKQNTKSPLRKFIEQQYLVFAQQNSLKHGYQFVNNNKFVEQLWDFMVEGCLLDSRYWHSFYEDDISECDLCRFFIQLDKITQTIFQEFLEENKYNSHEIMEYMLLFT